VTPDELGPLRITAALAAWCGLFALVVAKLLSPTPAIVAGVVVAVVSLTCSMYGGTAARQLRRQVSFVALVAVLVYVFLHLSGAHDPAALSHTLPPLLIGVLTAQGLTADKRHDVMLSVTVGEFMIVLAAGVAPTPALAAPLLIGWALAIVALVQSHQLHAADCSAPGLRSNARGRAATVAPTAAAVALAVAVGLVLFLLVPHPSEKAAQRRLRATIGAGQPGQAGRPGRSLGHYSSGALDMRTRGDLGNRPIAEVPASSPQLWRSRIYDTYDGVRWTADEGRGVAIGQGRIELPPDPLDEGVAPKGRRRTDDVRTLAGFDGLVLAPGTPVALDTSGRAAILGASQLLVQDRGGFTVTSALPETDAVVLAAAGGDDSVDGRWLQLPDRLPARVTALAGELTGSTPSRPAAVQAVSDYLAANKTYDVNSPVPPAGADAVDDFLFNSKTGFCEQFAAAEVVLLRASGIPSRMATGYGYGADQANGRRLFTSANLHAWVEVWYPGVGWSPADPTPPLVQAAAKPKVSTYNRVVQWIKKALSSPRRRLALAAFIVLLGAACFALVLLRRRRRSVVVATGTSSALAGALFTAFARLESALAADGRPRAPAETLAELERRLGADAAGRRALATLELACYSPHTVQHEDARAAAHAFEQLAASILAANAARGQLAGSIGVRR
jgi:hypothetical protein